MKKVLPLVLSAIIACIAAATLTACHIGNGGNSGHTHNYVWIDNGNGTHKQHCSVDGCNEPDVNVGNHTFGADGKCACGAEKPTEHKHAYTEKVVESRYLKTAATCETKAVYFYSCECGEKGTETFEYGEALGHNYGDLIIGTPANCTQNGTKTHYYCSICEKNFDAEKNEITDLVIPASHKYNKDGICVFCGVQKHSEGLLYTLSNDEISYIVSGIGTCTDSDIIIPSSHNGKPITRIAEHAFGGCDELTSVMIPDSITSMGSHVFEGCSKLTHTIIPDSITSMGSHVFVDCNSLTSVSIGNGVASIEWCTFYNCSNLTSVTIGNSVTSIGFAAFDNCSNLTSIVIPNSVTSIHCAFDNCSSLTSVYYSGTIDEWVQINFVGDRSATPLYYAEYFYINNKLVTEANIVTATKINAFAFANYNSLTSVIIPDSVINIGTDAFRDCPIEKAIVPAIAIVKIRNDKLKEITITSGEIKDDTSFWQNKSLTKVTIGDGVTSTGQLDFSGCSNLTDITIGNRIISIDCGAFSGCESLARIVIPDSVTSIGYQAFSGCRNLTSVKIGNNVKSIDYSAFKNCSSLTSIIIPDSVTSIGQSVFWGCDNLTSVTIGSGVTSMGSSVFAYCNNLQYNEYGDCYYLGNEANPYVVLISVKAPFMTSCVINESCKIVYENSFHGCSNLTSVTLPDSVVSIGNNAFSDCSSLTSVNIGSNVKNIDYSVFENCISLTSIVIPYSVTSIGSNAFSGCSSLANITIGNGVTNIDYGVFKDCADLKYDEYDNAYYLGNESNPYLILVKARSKDITSCTIVNTCKLISVGAFYECRKLTDINIPDSVALIGNEAFYNCNDLKNITMGNGVKTIGDRAFSECSSLTNVVIPDGVTSIGYEAFNNCSSLTSVVISDSVITVGHSFSNCPIEKATVPARAIIEIRNSNLNEVIVTSGDIIDQAFLGEDSLTSVIFGDGITSIGAEAFSDCYGLTSITIPDSVTSLGYSAFENCSNLTNVTIGNGVKSIGYAVFRYCSSLTSVTIGNSVVNISDSAFYECNKLTNINIPEGIADIGDAFQACSSLKYNEHNNGCYLGNENNPYLVLVTVKSKDMTSFAVNEKCKIIIEGAFYNTSFKNVTIGDNVTSIGDIFYNCRNLTTVIIGAGVTNIGSETFRNCNELEKVFYKGTASEWENIAIDNYGNYNLTKAKHYYYSESQPTESGNYWRYVDGEIVIW